MPLKVRFLQIIGKEIAIAVKEGGPNPDNNSKLRDVIAKAKSNNMPNDTIERGIKRAAGDINSVNYETVTYEGYGPSGVAIIVETLTDNRNRTAANVRMLLQRAAVQSVLWAVCLICLIKKVLLSLIRKNMTEMLMSL